MKKCLLIIIFVGIIQMIFAINPGEKLTFSIKYGMITAGHTIGEFKEDVYNDSIPCYTITSVSKTNAFFDKLYKVRDKIESRWDKKTLSSLYYYKQLNEGKYWQKRIHFFYPDQGFTVYWSYSRKTKKIKEKKFDIPQNTQDVISAIYWVRMQKFVVGDTLNVNVTSDGKSYVAKVKVIKKEKIKTLFGKKECFLVEPQLGGEATFKYSAKMHIWFTADDKKIPVKMESKVVFGSFKIVLVKAENI